MDSRGNAGPPSCCAASASLSALVAAARRSASATSAGHRCATTHGLCGEPAANAYPPTPSTPLASVVDRSTPSSDGDGNTVRGATGTPSFSWRTCPA
eukprot:4706595-Pleurochrysis_carterae.AAC.1